MVLDKSKTKTQLMGEIDELRQRVADLERLESGLQRTEEALRKKEEELSIIFDSVPAMIFYKDPESRFLRVNQGFADAMGASPGEIEGKTAFELFPVHAEDYWRNDKEVMRTGAAKTGLIQPLETPRGRRWIRTDKIPYRDEDGTIIGIIGFAVDITDLIRAEEALRDGEEALRAVLDAAADGILAVDVNGRVQFANKRFSEMWHIPPDLMEAGDDRELLRFVTNQLIDAKRFLTKVQQLYQSFRDDFDTIYFRDGRVFERESRAFAKGTELGGRVWSFHDITELKRTEEALRKKEEELRVIFDSVPAMIFYKDRENRFIRVNQALANTTGLSREEIEGKTAFELFPVHAEDYWRDDKEVMSTGVPKTNIIEPVETARGQRWVRTDKIPYRDEDGTIIGIIGFAVDITDLKRNEGDWESYS